jgi:hypothetical protein
MVRFVARAAVGEALCESAPAKRRDCAQAAAASAAQLHDVFFGDGRVAVCFVAHAAVGAALYESASDSRASVLREVSGYRDAYLTLRRRRSMSETVIEILGDLLCWQCIFEKDEAKFSTAPPAGSCGLGFSTPYSRAWRVC